MDEDRAGQRIARHLTATASGWESLGRPDTELYRGARLVAALEWRSRAAADLSQLEGAFLNESEKGEYHEQLSRELDAQQKRLQNRRLRALLVGALVLLVVAAGAGAVAVERGGAARKERDSARAAEQVSQHEALVGRSLALRSTNRSVAALLAVEAYQQRPDVLAQSALLGTFTASPGFLGYHYLDGKETLNAAPIGLTLRAVVAGVAGRLGVLDIVTGVIRYPFGPPPPHAQGDSVLKVSGDGSRVAQLVSAPRDPDRCGSLASLLEHDGRGCSTLLVYDTRSGRRVLGPILTPFSAGDVAISTYGSVVAVAGGYDGDVVTYDVRSGRLLARKAGLPRPPGVSLWRDTAAVVFDRSETLFLGSMAGPIRQLDPRSLRTLRTIPAPRLSSHNSLVYEVEPGILVAAGDQALLAVDLPTGNRLWSTDLGAEPMAEPCEFLANAAGVRATYCGNRFGQIEERDLGTGQRSGAVLDAQLGGVGDVVTSYLGPDLVAFGSDQPVYSRWRLNGTGLLSRPLGSGPTPVGYDPSGRYLLQRNIFSRWWSVVDEGGIESEDVPQARHYRWVGSGTLAYWGPDGGGLFDVESQRSRQVAGIDDTTSAVFPDPDHQYAWVTTTHGSGTTVQRVPLGIARDPTPSLSVPGFVQSVSLTPDERVLVTYADSDDWETSVYDLETGRLLGTGLSGQLRTAVSATGRLVGGDAAGNVTEFDTETLEPVSSLPAARTAPSSLQFDDAGKLLLVTSADQQVQLYDVASRSRIGDPISSSSPNGWVEGWLRPDGRAIAINAGSVVEWAIDFDRAVEAACVFAGRNLTRAEWATYLGAGQQYRRTCPDLPADP